MSDISPNHPRAESLRIREKLVEGFEKGLVTPEGLAAHGRGEAFDYILGEETTELAKGGIEAGVAELLLADKPVLSVNGNVAALVPEEIAALTERIDIEVEVNLFHRSKEREEKIAEHLKETGVDDVLGTEEEYSSKIPEIQSHRRVVDERGIKAADTVMVPLEDGDRTEALENLGKAVVTIDLNPMSRTAQAADVTIVDSITRALPLMVKEGNRLSHAPREELRKITQNFDNEENLRSVIGFMLERLGKLSENTRV